MILSAAEILRRYQKGQRHFEDLEIEGDFTGKSLAGAHFVHCFIVADFRNCDLSHSTFEASNVKTCDFRGANLSHATLTGLNVEATEFGQNDTNGLVFEENYCFGHVVSYDELL